MTALFAWAGGHDYKPAPVVHFACTTPGGCQLPMPGGRTEGCSVFGPQRSRKHGWFEVIVGKSVTAKGSSKRFAFVHNYDDKPKRRVFEVLK